MSLQKYLDFLSLSGESIAAKPQGINILNGCFLALKRHPFKTKRPFRRRRSGMPNSDKKLNEKGSQKDLSLFGCLCSYPKLVFFSNSGGLDVSRRDPGQESVSRRRQMRLLRCTE
jgi:hypothetical protein